MTSEDGSCPNCRNLKEKMDGALSSVSHDLKSPLSAIAGFAAMLGREMEDSGAGERWLEIVNRMDRAAHAALEMVGDIMAMARMEAGKEPVEPEWTYAPANELADLMETFRMEAEAKKIHFDLVTGFLPPVKWDFRRIRYHVLNNIVSNALKFTPQGGSITMYAHGENGVVTIAVEDSGPGVPVSERERNFQRFEQAGLASDRVFKGAGLGLANASLFVQRHGGRISVEDAQPNGARFVVELPVIAGEQKVMPDGEGGALSGIETEAA